VTPGSATVNLDLFPEIPEEARPRRIYVGAITQLDSLALRQRGYEPTPLLTLPRSTQRENIEYLYAKAQAIEEGTLAASAEERRQLALSMQAYGMLKDVQMRVNMDIGSESVAEILDWQKSRHTLRGQTTLVDATGMLTEEEFIAKQEEASRKLEAAKTRAREKVSGLKKAELRAEKKSGKKSKKTKKTRAAKTRASGEGRGRRVRKGET